MFFSQNSRLFSLYCAQDVDIDYSPVDLCKPLAPAFSSYESLIHNLYTPDPTSHSSLPPAPLPLTTHPAQDPTTGTTPQHNKHTHQGSFLHEPPLVREDGERGEGKSGLTCETVGLREEILSGGDVGSSSNTSGYSTGCNDSDNQHHESTGRYILSIVHFIHNFTRCYFDISTGFWSSKGNS